MQLAGCGAIVTGGASGLGLATVEMLVREGAYVSVIDLPGSPGEQVAARLGPSVGFAAADVRDEDAVARAIAAVVSAAGGLHVAVCCAGTSAPGRIVGRDGPMPIEQFRRVIDVNLIGTFNVLRLAAAQMASQELMGEDRGVIVLTASVAAFEGQIGQSPYAASKGGIVSLTIVAARDLAKSQIRVNTIAPGTFDTPMLARLSEETRNLLASVVPHPRRLGRPDEYARLVQHIIENGMINGETIRLDGALRMGPR